MITDLISLVEFMRGAIAGLPAVKFFLPLGNGAAAVNEISAYYTNDYAGTTAFLQIAESKREYNGAGQNMVTFLCSITIAEKPADDSSTAALESRNTTFCTLLEFLGHLETVAESAARNENDYTVEIAVSEKIYPIGLLANVRLEGHYIDLDISVPANHLLYPTA